MQITIHPDFAQYETEILNAIGNFESGKLFVDGKRNKIRLFDVGDITLNIKSFKIPNLINRIAYRFFRKSKARRSYEFAKRLAALKIGTPQPVAFAEAFSAAGLSRSFYISRQLHADLTYRELVEVAGYPDSENILRQFTRFSFGLHQKGVEFLDHSPGNTLIKKESDGYSFYLVDLNRMEFHAAIDFETRMKNLSRLTPQKEMVEVMSNEYSKLYKDKSEQEIFTRMWFYTDDFQKKFHRKIRLKKRFLIRK